MTDFSEILLPDCTFVYNLCASRTHFNKSHVNMESKHIILLICIFFNRMNNLINYFSSMLLKCLCKLSCVCHLLEDTRHGSDEMMIIKIEFNVIESSLKLIKKNRTYIYIYIINC